MQTINTLLLGLILLVTLYCIKLFRALHKRQSKANTQTQQSLRDLKRSIWQSYRQSESLQQLLTLLKFSAPIPPTRGWAASPDLLLTIADLVRTRKPGLVVELGSGASTLITSKAGARKIISIDHLSEYAEKTRQMLTEHRVRGVEVRVAPLKPHTSGVTWYDTTKLKDLKRIDMLIIDGPPGSENPEARKPALAELLNKLSPKATIVLDDVNRPGERALAEAFAKALPTHELRIYEHEKGTAVISPR